MTDTEAGPKTPVERKRISPASPYEEVLQFLVDEASLLDDDLQIEWLEMLTDDIVYKMPVRKTVARSDGRGFDYQQAFFDDERFSLGLRVRRNVEIESATDREPSPRCRRLVTNLRLYEGEGPEEYIALSNILLLRNSSDDLTYDLLSAEREDVIRRTSTGLKLARRTILVDQTRLGAPYLSVFL